MNETSMTRKVSSGCRAGQRSGLEEARVGAFHEADAGIVTELHGDLAEAGIDGGDVGGAALQKAVREAAGRCADVEAGAAGDVDLPVIESGGKLEAATADERQIFARAGGCAASAATDGPGLVDLLFVHQDAAGENQGAGALAAGDKSRSTSRRSRRVLAGTGISKDSASMKKGPLRRGMTLNENAPWLRQGCAAA